MTLQTLVIGRPRQGIKLLLFHVTWGNKTNDIIRMEILNDIPFRAPNRYLGRHS